jgi:DNA-binding GntR family transcriptional regulator
MPPVNRQQPLYLQVRDYYEELISSGTLAPGDPLPAERVIAAEKNVSPQTVVRAIELLRSAGLITRTPRGGSVVAQPRLIPGPQQHMAGVMLPASGRIEVTAAELTPAPAYIAPILGLLEAKTGFWPVIRREQVHYTAGGKPFLLAVSWFPPEFAGPVPELTAREPLFGVRNATALIAEATGRRATHGEQSWEARPVLDDGREGPLLRVDPGYVVAADVYWWRDEHDMLEYTESVRRQELVTVSRFTA